MIRQTLEI